MSRRCGTGSLCLLLSAAALGISGCAVGPNFVAPKPPVVAQYDTPESYGIDADKTLAQLSGATGGEVADQWWTLFRSADLDTTVQEAIRHSPNLASAKATLDAAKEAVTVAQAGYLPHLSASAGDQRTGGGVVGTQTGFTLGLNAGFSFNALGGATRRLVEEEAALADYSRYQLAAAYLTLAGGIANESLTIASTRLQIETTEELLRDDQKNLDLTNRMFEVGAAARTDVLTAESQLAADETSLPSLRQQLSVARHALAILVGYSPGEWPAPEFKLSEFKLPAELPSSLPSALVQRRPDILSAQAELHSDSAAIGVAVAQEFPSISLNASLTRDALTAGNLFHHFNRLWSTGGSLTQPLFEAGALRAQVREARDTYLAQVAYYQQTVISAFQQVADNLRALEHDAQRIEAYHHAMRVAADSLELQRISYAAGKTTVLQLIDAERTYAQERLGNASAEAQQLEDSASLYVALGGGWWQSGAVPP
jgi:NodT family efflux transporter outer membrane factor (OMF) lipoprotein